MGSGQGALVRCSVRDGAVVPYWLSERDQPWIRDLIEAYLAFAGEPRGRLDAHLRRLSGEARTGTGWAVAVNVLDRAFKTETTAAVPPQEARAAVFRSAAGRGPRAAVMATIAGELDVSVEALESSLFADLPGQRRLMAPEAAVSAASVALQCNLAIAQAALKSSSEVVVMPEGNARAIVRHAWLRGLICTVSRPEPDGPVSLEISGPLSLFKQTSLYGRHLAELIPLLAWSRRFRLEASCVIRGSRGRLRLGPADPIPAAAAQRLYDSLLEKRFAREFTRLAGEWELLREPEPIAVEGTLVFPDFSITHRRDRTRRWLLEIVGFWTATYVEQKLRRLRSAGLLRLILCIDASRDCGAGELPAGCSVVRYRKRIDPSSVLETIEAADARH